MTLLTLPAMIFLRAHPKQIFVAAPYRLQAIAACHGCLYPQGFCSLFVLIRIAAYCQGMAAMPKPIIWA
ncbi:hypothetical protein, partial [Mesorhizobium sp.]|uniref:hypothetical protein n=1 Tax=Mesorhizobium sp. TaxID=1871066 RepID=UPI0025BE404F